MASLLSSALNFVKCLFLWLAASIEALLMTVFNAIIAALMAVLDLVTSLLPTVTLPDLSPPSFIAQINYVFPLSDFVYATGLVVIVLLAWQVAQIALRWIRAVA